MIQSNRQTIHQVNWNCSNIVWLHAFTNVPGPTGFTVHCDRYRKTFKALCAHHLQNGLHCSTWTFGFVSMLWKKGKMGFLFYSINLLYLCVAAFDVLLWFELSVKNEVFYCFLKSQVLQAVSNICQAIINQHSQMLLPCNLLTFPQKALVTESIWSHE